MRLAPAFASLTAAALLVASPASAAPSTLTDYKKAVARDKPFVHYSLSAVDSARFGAPSDPVSCTASAPIRSNVSGPDGTFCTRNPDRKATSEPGPFTGARSMEIGSPIPLTDNPVPSEQRSLLGLGLPSSASWTGEFTLEYWARWRGTFGSAVNINFPRGMVATGFACQGTGALTTFDLLQQPAEPSPKCRGLESFSNRIVAARTALSHNEWHYVTLIRTGKEMQLWVDAARSSDGSVIDKPPVPTSIWVGGGGLPPAGMTLIAEPALYLEALSKEQIQRHYAAGREGSDTLCGVGNDDLFIGEAGTDRLSGGDGSDALEGGPGADTFNGGEGNDSINGGPGNDRTGNVRRENCSGASLAGDDTIDAGAGNDSMEGGPGADSISGGPGNDRLDGGPGQDTINGGPGSDSVDVRDRQVDTVDCGIGRDSVKADPADKLVGCEKVSR